MSRDQDIRIKDNAQSRGTKLTSHDRDDFLDFGRTRSGAGSGVSDKAVAQFGAGLEAQNLRQHWRQEFSRQQATPARFIRETVW